MPENEATNEATEADATNESVGTEESDTTNWQQRYEDLRPQANRWESENQQYQELFNDPVAVANAIRIKQLDEAAVLEALGYQVPDDEADDDFEYDDDPNAELVQRLEALEGTIAETTQAEEAAQLEDLENAYFEQEIGKIAQAEGRDLTQEELEALDALGDRIVGDDGLPDYEAAWKRFGQLTEARHKAYLESKRASGVAAGTAGQESIDWNDPEASHRAAVDTVQAVLDAEQQ